VSEAERANVPCLIPVQLSLESGETSRGFMTRLGPSSATISSDPVPAAGSRIELRFRRPTDNKEIDVLGEVGEMLAEGGLWRGREAMLVNFDQPIEEEALPTNSGEEIRKQMQQQERRGANPSRRSSSTDGLGLAFQAAGRGRRRKTQTSLVSESILETTGAPPVEEHPTDPNIPTVGGGLSSGAMPDPRDLREQLNVGAEIAEDGEIPPIMSGPSEQTGASSPAESSESDFFGRFSSDTSQHGLPPVLVSDGEPPVGGRNLEDMLATSTQPGVAGRLPSVQEVADASPPAVNKTRAQTAVPGAPGDHQPPWEAEGEDPARSFIPRHVRIASSLDVTFWSRGRKHDATAQNFSREGAFLAYPGDPPIRGAIVRVEFPLDWSGESLPVRFNAEVRWHRADRPGSNVPEGFGVQILTFESPKDQGRYDEMLVLLLDLDPSDASQTSSGYRWGAPNR